MATVVPDMWDEVVLVSIYRQGDATTGEVNYAAINTGWEINEGDYPWESIPNSAGGRIGHQSPQEDGEITLELYPVGLGGTSGVGLFQQWHQVSGTPPAAYDTSEPMASDSSWIAGQNRVRDSFRVSILWTNDPASVATAAGATAASTDGLRFYATDCRIKSHKTSWSPSDGEKVNVTFKYPSWNKEGTARIGLWEGGLATALGALGAYS